jgi:hypothetical protein
VKESFLLNFAVYQLFPSYIKVMTKALAIVSIILFFPFPYFLKWG